MNSTTEASNNGPDQETAGPYGYSIGIFFGVISVLIIITYCYYIYSRYRLAADTNINNRLFFRRNSVATTTTADTIDDDSVNTSSSPEGFDEATIRACPKLLYSQTKNTEVDLRIASGCSICLQDYKDTDFLRLLPGCGHFFHLKCVDPWLKLHLTCPICRNPPMPFPQETPV